MKYFKCGRQFSIEILYFVLACLYSASAFGADTVRLETQFVSEGSEDFIQLRLVNAGAEDLTLYRNSLPWVERPGVLELKGIVLNQDLIELESIGRVHNSVGQVKLAPGVAIDGRINLRGRLRAFSKFRAESSIVILWSYRPRSPTNSGLASVSGVLIVPKKDQLSSQ